MDESDNYSEALYQGNPVDASHEEGTAPTLTEHSSDKEDSTEHKSAPREAAEPTQQNQVSVQPKIDYEKSYKELEKTYTRDSQRRAQIEREYKEARQRLDQYQAVDQQLIANPKAMEYLRQVLSGQKEVDPVTANDPLYKQYLEPALQELNGMKQYIQNQVQQQNVSKAESFLDSQVAIASQEIKAHFGRDMTQEDLGKIYGWMSEKNYYDAKAAVRDLMWDDFGTAKSQAILQSQQAKKGMGTTKTTGVNTNAAKPKSDKTMSIRQAWNESRKELGLDS